MPFEFQLFQLPGLFLIKPKMFGDQRGFFLEFYKHSDFVKAGIKEHFVQDNYSRSERGVLRGLHYQKNPHAQGKLMCCMRGHIYDVAVDVRIGSPEYGKWTAVELSEENRHMLYVPPGFAHGFQVLSETADVVYKCTKEYSPEDEQGIIWNDPDLNVTWPLSDPILSKKDVLNPRLNECGKDFFYSPSL
ncbi:MAG: dTDP-4-dehydrorhamnose 3,5-epimerase [Nitrospirota bacterium]